jgi:hypothetical protein
MTPENIREWDKTFDDKSVTAEVARARARIEIAAQLSELNLNMRSVIQLLGGHRGK